MNCLHLAGLAGVVLHNGLERNDLHPYTSTKQQVPQFPSTPPWGIVVPTCTWPFVNAKTPLVANLICSSLQGKGENTGIGRLWRQVAGLDRWDHCTCMQNRADSCLLIFSHYFWKSWRIPLWIWKRRRRSVWRRRCSRRNVWKSISWDVVIPSRFEHIKQKTKARTRESMYGNFRLVHDCRKRKRREFALLRDKECEGMTVEEKQAWMDKKKEESRSWGFFSW